MEMETGKLFVGGISWETNEESLREYFEAFGEVVEAVIMKDRTTGRARGFGFVVFADASVADKVVRERHVIDGRTVETKKAVPRDDHQNTNKSISSVQGSPVLTRTKKIFVGGLASTVTESDFKEYFDQFGTITDVVVMYDHNTQRPRGFGFITFDSEEAVDKVLIKTFHELNGKMVEVKRAVPKDLSPGPTRSPSPGYNYGGLNRMSSLLNAYSPGYNSGMRMDGRFSPLSVGRSGYSPYSPSSYNTGLSLDSGLGLNFGGPNGESGLGYGRDLGSYYNGNTNRYNNPILQDLGNGRNGPLLNATNRNVWDNGSFNYGSANSATSNAFHGSATGNSGMVGHFGTIGEIWGSSQGRGSGSFGSANMNYGIGQNNFGARTSYGGGNGGVVGAKPSYSVGNVGDGSSGNLFEDGFVDGDHAWRSSSPDLDGSLSFGYGRLGGADGGYSVTNRSNRGFAA